MVGGALGGNAPPGFRRELPAEINQTAPAFCRGLEDDFVPAQPRDAHEAGSGAGCRQNLRVLIALKARQQLRQPRQISRLILRSVPCHARSPVTNLGTNPEPVI
ncbi:hypothetical protein VZ95_11540 [Elstera litoralis]|uniref:Uncharacterized protein n=2 Tax=Elstera litoralis TaxID=552518 RepID=A0A0F3IRP5_9PROT|nr:hypothetical protein VZ95_11540 [Elstera litoralis]